MRAVVVYESMFGNTHLIAEAIGRGLQAAGDVTVVPVGGAAADVLRGADLVVVGGPTHAHGLSRESTRASAVAMTHKPGADLEIDHDAEGSGLREWFDQLEPGRAAGAAFDTRLSGPAAFTGRASKGISSRLRHHGFDVVLEPESFIVSRENHLLPGEEAHAREWGERLAALLSKRTSAPA